MITQRDQRGRQVLIEDPSKRAWHYRANRFRLDRCQGEGRRHHPELHVHHLDGNYRNCDPANLLTLCRWCHLRVHGKRTMKQAGFSIARNRR